MRVSSIVRPLEAVDPPKRVQEGLQRVELGALGCTKTLPLALGSLDRRLCTLTGKDMSCGVHRFPVVLSSYAYWTAQSPLSLSHAYRSAVGAIAATLQVRHRRAFCPSY